MPGGRIVLHPSLAAATRGELLDVLCHEAAHAATYLRFGPAVRPHGPEWRQLVLQTGRTPALRLDGSSCALVWQPIRRPDRLRFHHLCPVCQNQRWARRRMTGWRCADCVAAGLPGTLVVTDQV
jgi:predicted SprT family Zn-dependent metalloprotease